MQGVTLKCLGSSSSGNGYIIETDSEALMIECGISMQSVKKALNWNIGKIAACIISHKHQDHSKHLPEVIKNGIKVLALPDVFDRLNAVQKSFCNSIEPMHGYKVGGFKIFAFNLHHANNDGTPCPCIGFVIEHIEMGKLLFVTDTMMLKYRFPGINHIMIEANYEDGILDYNIENGTTEAWQKPRLLASHLEVRQTAKILQGIDLSIVQNIVLLHLSSRNSDPDMFKDIMQGATGKPVHIAQPGLTLPLNLQPY
ncbi:MAG: MBL fold metallo-hydrolase [Prevotella sp.]|nr:MBL fold metallo-hydrolase [Bacteroides sp.]MCM1445868.1 MBL fold metallo-hydrolase [Prevotella sp.]